MTPDNITELMDLLYRILGELQSLNRFEKSRFDADNDPKPQPVFDVPTPRFK